jgi:hypothetical protein
MNIFVDLFLVCCLKINLQTKSTSKQFTIPQCGRICSIVPDGNGCVWIGTEASELFIWSEKVFLFFTHNIF